MLNLLERGFAGQVRNKKISRHALKILTILSRFQAPVKSKTDSNE